MPEVVTKITLRVTQCKINHGVILLPYLAQNNPQVHLEGIMVDRIKLLGSVYVLCTQKHGVCHGRGAQLVHK